MAKYVDHPYMERYIHGKITKNLSEVVKLIDEGEADILEESMQKHDKKKNRDNNGVPEKYLGDKKPKKDKSDKKYDKNKNDKKHRDRERELKRRRKEKTLDAKTNQVIRRYKRMEKECRKTDIAKVILQQRQASFLSVSCMTNKAQAA